MLCIFCKNSLITFRMTHVYTLQCTLRGVTANHRCKSHQVQIHYTRTRTVINSLQCDCERYNNLKFTSKLKN